MNDDYAIRVYKQYFNFSAAHFMVFDNGEREPLHGHNYRVQVQGQAKALKGDMVFDFLHLKPIVREVCDSLDHKFLLPTENLHLKVQQKGQNTELQTPDGAHFSFPSVDVLPLPLSNISAERLAIYLFRAISQLVKERFDFAFSDLQVEVEETPGQAAVYQQRERTPLLQP